MEKELDLHAIWQVIRKRWILIIAIPLLAALVSALVSIFIITPQYKASTTLMVTRPDDKAQILYQDIQISRQLVATYREIVHSRRVLSQAITARSLSFSVDELRQKVEVESVRDTEIIIIYVVDSDPELAKNIANDISAAFMDQIQQIMQVENVSVVDAAVTPGSPESPRVRMNIAVAFVLGMMAALGLAFLHEYVDQSIKDPEEAKKLLNLPVVGLVPRSDGGPLFVAKKPRSPEAEAFRTLRTNIQYTGVDRPMKTILVTGANPACGKSTISANLAVTIAQTGASVLIVDADMRRPLQHKIFGVYRKIGLSNLIFDEQLELDRALQSTEYKNLKLLACGPVPPYPAELLGSEKMKQLVASFAKKFDYVIMDSPPVIAVTDAALLSRLADGTIIVLDHGRVRRDEALDALESLQKVQAYMIGSVINNVPPSKGYYYYSKRYS